MDAPDPQAAAGLAFEDFRADKQPGGGEMLADATAVVPPPLGEVGADPAINQVAVNIRRELALQLHGSGATVLDASYCVRAAGIAGGFLYQPDVIVDGGESDHGARLAHQPKVIFELAAAGTERAAFIGSQRIHEKLSTVAVHALVDTARRCVLVHRRQGNGWQEETLTGADESLRLPEIRCALTLESIYQNALGGGDEGRI